jgi:hypothetical protein
LITHEFNEASDSLVLDTSNRPAALTTDATTQTNTWLYRDILITAKDVPRVHSVQQTKRIGDALTTRVRRILEIG